MNSETAAIPSPVPTKTGDPTPPGPVAAVAPQPILGDITSPPGGSRRLPWKLVCLLLLVVVAVPVWRAFTNHAKAQPAAAASPNQVIAVVRVVRRDLYNEVPISAEFRPFAEVELHAKVSGFVQEINVDFGDRVKAGQLLARLEVPELKDELNRALAAQDRAQAAYHDAHQIYARIQQVVQQNPNLVAQQELDTAQAKDNTAEAGLAAAKADVEKDRTLLAYTQITAPFDGVITHRYVDPGALIQSGTASQTQSLPLVRVSDNYKLRLDFPVSVGYVKDIRLGDPVEVRVDSLGGKSFTGRISRFTDQVDEDTRTMMTEIEVPNPNLEIMPGMYANVVLPVEKRPQVLTVPIQAVSGDEKPTVYVVNSQQAIEERPVTLGLETPSMYEVTAGLKEGDLVMIGNRSEVTPGKKVEARLTETLAQQ